MAVLRCPPDPSHNSGRAWGHPLAPLTNWRDRACGHVHSLTSDHGLVVAVVRVVAARVGIGVATAVLPGVVAKSMRSPHHCNGLPLGGASPVS